MPGNGEGGSVPESLHQVRGKRHMMRATTPVALSREHNKPRYINNLKDPSRMLVTMMLCPENVK